MKKVFPFFPSTNLRFSENLPAVAIIFRGDTVLIRKFAEQILLPCTAETEFMQLRQMAGNALYVGNFNDMECGVWELADDCSWENPSGTEFIEIRFAMHTMDSILVNAVARARELLFWRRKRRFCGLFLTRSPVTASRMIPTAWCRFPPVNGEITGALWVMS